MTDPSDPKEPVRASNGTAAGLISVHEQPRRADAATSAQRMTPLESAIAGLWSVLLKATPRSRSDDFFLLGGDARRATQLHAQIKALFGVDLPPNALSAGTATIAEMAGAIEAARRGEPREGDSRADAPLRRRADRGPAPLSHTQRRAWFLAQLDPGSHAYNQARAYVIEGALDLAALREALQALIERHEILRTTYGLVGEEPRQFIQEQSAADLEYHDLSSMPAAERGAALDRVLRAAASEPFDLERGPVVRFALVRRSQSESVFVRTWHHIASDGWSSGLFERELSALYRARAAGDGTSPPALPIQYADYAVWQGQWLSGARLERQLVYWKERLAGLETLELPADFPRPAMQSARGAQIEIALPDASPDRLKALARSEGATFFMAGLAAFKVLLYRLGGSADITVGTPIAGRGRAELEALIGFFANTLVLRTDLSGGPSFREVLRRVRETALGAYSHQDLPFEKLVEELAPARDLSRNPLFQVCFALPSVPPSPLAFEGARVSRLPLPTDHAKFDLTLDLIERDGRLHASIEYCTDLFAAVTIERMAAHFGVLLRSILDDPERSIDALELMRPAERDRLLAGSSGGMRDYPETGGLASLFEAQVRRSPAALALRCGDEHLTYGELAGRADRLAARLRARGVESDVLVAICLERGLDLIVAILATLKAGGAYVPLDAELPEERLAFMLKDCAVRVLVTDSALLARFPQDAPALCIDREPAGVTAADEASPAARKALDDLACVIYTSGSTGKPKGVMVPQRGICNHIAWITERLQLAPTDRFVHNTSVSFDASVWEILAPLATGASLFVPEPGVERDMTALVRVLREQSITVLQVVPTALRALVAEPGFDQCTSLRHVVCGGEPLDYELVKRFGERLPHVRLGNFYGPTEASIDASSFDVSDRPTGEGVVPIGRPIANTRCYVLDARLQPLPVGVAGELFIGGAGLARGYLNRPELTAERFIADPFHAGERLYRTGDRARYLSDGNLAFLGRTDQQVKLRGYRIELGEIEAALHACAGVAECAVVVREDAPGLQRLAAYVTGDCDPGALAAQLKAHLPDYMVPAAFVSLEAMPLLPNGKLDRKALPAPDYLQAGVTGGDAAPGSEMEALIAGPFAELLGLPRVGVHDDFFALGGHSLLAGQLVARLTRTCQVDLPLRAIFESPTVSGLARAIERRRREGRSEPEAPIAPTPDGVPLPLSFAQQRLWFIEQLNPGTGTYNVPIAVRLRGALRPEALQASLDALVARHESLRTTFVAVEGEARQVIHPAGSIELRRVDVTAPAAPAEPRVQQIARAERDAPFDLARGPLARATLIREAEDAHVLLVIVHHIVFDGWSADVFERELSTLYNAALAGKEARLPALPIRYADYAGWQRQWLAGERLEQQIAYWRDSLAGLATLELPLDHTRPAMQSYRGARVTSAMTGPLLEGLKALSRAEGVTLFMTGLAAFQVLMYRYSGTEDVAVGTPIAARRRAEVEGLVGFFANTLVLRSNLAGEPGFRAVLAQVRERVLDAYTHQDLPFEKLVEELAPRRDPSRNPLFQVCFALQTAPAPALSLDGIEASRVTLSGTSAKFDLTLTLRETGSGLAAHWEYCTDLFERATIERMAEHFRVLLESIVANPGQRISRLALLDEAARERLLVQWNAATADYPTGKSLHEVFEARVVETPQASAVIHQGLTLSYAELNARANRLAHCLLARGVGPQARVGICLARGPQLLWGLLGILKAGAAYVPLDPEQPAQRLATMLRDSGAELVLTEAGLVERLAAFPGASICLDRDVAMIDAHGTANPAPRVTSADLAYVMYTSGSTGEPKGVAIRHESILRLVCRPNYIALAPADTIAQVSNIAFDAATFEIWGALLNGARLALIPRDAVLVPQSLVEALEAHRVSCMFLTTALFNRIALERPDAFGRLRYLLFGGEVCDPERARAVLDAGGPEHLVHVYGPTETTTFATFHEVRHVDPHRTIPIGRPISATEVFVLDERGEPVPEGVIGELCIGGPGVAQGYVGRPAETAARFVPHPLRPDSGERVYRSGDLVRWRPEGCLEFVGRNDDQLKIRGFRIEPSEVSARLNQHPAVQSAHVMPWRGPSGDTCLAAFYVPSDAGRAAPAAAELRRHLASQLPGYMVPLYFVPLASIPLGPTGKVDQRALPDPAAGESAATGYVAPRDAVEETLCRAWAEVLGIERVGLDDNFFDIGGHSLLAARLFARLDDALGQSLPLGVLFAAPTVRALAEHYRGTAPIGVRSALIALTSSGSRSPIYAVPGVFGNVVGFADLARELGREQPFYALQSPGLDGSEPPLDSIEAMAVRYVAEIRSIQPHGPYTLVGQCFGATVAYEMARRLIGEGEEIAFIGLLDPTRREGDLAVERTGSAPRSMQGAVALARFVADRLRLYRDESQGLDFKDRVKYYAQKLRSVGQTLRQGERLRSAQRELWQREVYRANVRALDHYRRHPIDGRLRALEVFETVRPGSREKRMPTEWGSFWGGTVARHVVAGKDSGDMLTGANARALARLLVERLRAARGDT